MSKKAVRLLSAVLIAAVVLVFGGCGGGKPSINTSSTSPSSGHSSTGFTSYPSEESSALESSQGTSSEESSTKPGVSSVSPGTTDSSSSSRTSVSSGGTKSTSQQLPKGIKYEADPRYLYGVGYVEDQMNNRVQVHQAAYIIKSLGARSVRVWVSGAMLNSTTFVQWQVERLHNLVDSLQSSGIQVIFNFMGFEPYGGGDWTSVPLRDTTPDSNYMKTLDAFELKCKTIAAEFPEVKFWEIGNEWNHDPFLHPVGWKEDGTGTPAFTIKEKADITTDLMARIVKGVRAGGNDGLIIMPAMAPVDGMDGISMTGYLEHIYKNIKSGNFGSTNARDYFGALAWHPYFVGEPDQNWVNNNHRLHKIASNYGDGHLKTFLTEYGFPDGGNPRADAQQAEWMVKGYELVKTQMPYVESMHYYRLFTDTSRGADLYGLIHQPEDGFGPKAKGLGFQKMAGGLGDLSRFFMPLDHE